MSIEAHCTTVPVERAVTGIAISDGEHARCGYCGRSIGEGSPAEVYAYSMSDERDITVAQISCMDCAPDAISHPTLGGTEWLVRGTLALQSNLASQVHRLVFVSDEGVIDVSSPTESSEGEMEQQQGTAVCCRQP